MPGQEIHPLESDVKVTWKWGHYQSMQNFKLRLQREKGFFSEAKRPGFVYVSVMNFLTKKALFWRT